MTQFEDNQSTASVNPSNHSNSAILFLKATVEVIENQTITAIKFFFFLLGPDLFSKILYTRLILFFAKNKSLRKKGEILKVRGRRQ